MKVSRAVGMEELRLQIIVACQKMVPPNDEFRTRIRNHMNTHMSDNRGHAGDNSLQNHWSQIVAAIMSSEQKYLPDTAKDGVRINSDMIVSYRMVGAICSIPYSDL